jgi:deazaflavin-dependent oxidoreductase (nitroreductase family)
MAAPDQITDSPTGWVNRHVRQYVASDGATGHQFNGHEALLITTVGRKTGARRRTAVYYGRAGDDYVVIASNGGAATHPNWYRNLVATPEVGVQVGSRRFTARARTTTGEERAELFAMMGKIFPPYLQYQKKAARELPVVILERIV